MFWRKKPRRTVALLFKINSAIRVVDVVQTQSGYMAKWGASDDTWVILNGDGTITGYEGVIGWRKVSGWADIPPRPRPEPKPRTA